MKSLLALLLLGLALAFGYWKTQYPDATVDDLTVSANDGVSRLTSGISTVFDGGASKAALEKRLESLESDLLETQNLADPGATNARLDSLEAALVTTQQSTDPAVINGRLTDAERRMAATEAKLNRFKSDLSASIESISSDSANNDTQTTTLDGKLDLLNRRIEEQAQQFDADSVSNALSTLEDDIASLQAEQERLATEQNLKLSGMDEKLGSFTTRFNTLSVEASNGDPDAAASINAQIDQRIVVLEDKLATTNSDSLRLESLANELSAARVKLQAMEQGVNDANTQITDLTSQLASLSTQSESLSIEGQQAQLRSQLQQMQNQINQSGDNAEVADVAVLTYALKASRDQIEALEQRVDELPATSSTADEATKAQNALQAQIEELETKLSEVQTAPDPNLVNTLNQVEEKVSELAAKGYVTQEELREQQRGKSIEYKIYFEPDSTEITKDAGVVLNSFIAQEKNRTTGVSIYGFTDRIGSATYNQALALQRATNVRSYLIQNGFSYTKIKSLSGLGEDAAANQPDNEEDAQQRSVVLYAQQPQ